MDDNPLYDETVDVLIGIETNIDIGASISISKLILFHELVWE